MGFSFNKITGAQPAQIQSDIQQLDLTQTQLTGSELDFLLRTLKSCTLKGEQVEMFYNVVIKLQNQYVEQTKQSNK